jgi:hypothetical protein
VDVSSPKPDPQPVAKTDYFNTVTEQQRKRIGGHDAPGRQLSRGTIPLMICFLAVVLVSVFGILRAYRTPPADDLYATILGSERAPDTVREEIGQFLSSYPDDERVEKVYELDGIAAAIALHKVLRNRSNLANPNMTQIEKQFLQITNLNDQDAPSAFSKMRAFLTVHSDEAGLSERDQLCVEAAKSYLIKMAHDSRRDIEFNREMIDQAFERAAAGTDEEAVTEYEAVIKLYDEAEWARSQLETARERLAEIKSKVLDRPKS